MTRLPTPGSDNGSWGDILNDFLLVEHNSDGTLKASASLATKADDSAVVHLTGAETINGTKTFTSSPVVPTPSLGGHAATKTYVDTTVAAGAADATTTSKGIVQLAGDLGGTAASPTVPGLTTKQPLNSDLTAIAGLSAANDDIIQRKAGAWTNRTIAQVKTDLALTKSDVGLSNVDNTSDATKNSATATLTNKTLTAPVISTIVNTGTLTLPTSTDTLVGRSTTDTLSNKTLVSPTISGTSTWQGATSGSTTLRASFVAGSTALVLPAANDTLVARATTDTLTNKRITQRVTSVASSASPTPSADNDDLFILTAQAAAAAFGAPTGTPTEGQSLIIRIKDNGTARAITWNAIYRGIGVTLPTTTVINKTLYVGLKYNAVDTKWDAIAVAQE